MFAVLSDKKWHCRSHNYTHIPSTQLAGGGGIQGLQRGNRSKPGICIESKTELCPVCKKQTRWDRWTGEYQAAGHDSKMTKSVRERILTLFNYLDVIEQGERPAHQLIVDHRFPLIRWGEHGTRIPENISDRGIKRRFQLLKFDGNGNHNMLKSRACESCFKDGKRGKPFGISHFYYGNEDWPKEIPAVGRKAERGCFGCGWYDFEAWRKSLNRNLLTKTETPAKIDEVEAPEVRWDE